MTLTLRRYRGAADLEALRQFLIIARAAVAARIYLHPGDVVWRIADTPVECDPHDLVMIWAEDDDSVAGFHCSTRCTRRTTSAFSRDTEVRRPRPRCCGRRKTPCGD